MTELERAAHVQAEVRRIDDEIKIYRDLMSHAISANDEINKNIWARKIKELRERRHNLHESVTYVKFQTFIQVVKTLLTKDQYHDAWRRVDQILEHPELMQ